MNYARKRGREIAMKHARTVDISAAAQALESGGDLYVAGVADRLSEDPGARLADAMADEQSRWVSDAESERFQTEQDLAWFRRLELEATTDEQREFARQWRAEMEAMCTEYQASWTNVS